MFIHTGNQTAEFDADFGCVTVQKISSVESDKSINFRRICFILESYNVEIATETIVANFLGNIFISEIQLLKFVQIMFEVGNVFEIA